MTTPSQERERLEPCPRCGADPRVVGMRRFRVWCGSCDWPAQSRPAPSYRTKEDAIAAWNARPDDDTLSARVAELEVVNAAQAKRIEAIREPAKVIIEALGDQGWDAELDDAFSRLVQALSKTEGGE